MKRFVLSAVMLVAACGAAFAQGSIGMGGTLSPSYQLIISQGTSGPVPSGTSTAATIGLGTILYYGTSSNATGVSQNNTGDTHGSDTGNIALSFPVKIEIDKANSSSANFTLNAALSAAAVTNTSVTISGSDPLTTTAADTTLTATGAYGTAVGYTVTLNVSTAVVGNSGLGQTIDLSFTPN